MAKSNGGVKFDATLVQSSKRFHKYEVKGDDLIATLYLPLGCLGKTPPETVDIEVRPTEE